MKIILFRHGETEDNTNHIIQGQKPGLLNERGKEQARAARTILAECDIDYVICSDLRRAQETFVEAMPEYKGELVYDQRLRERSFGFLEGQHRDVYVKDQEEHRDDVFAYCPKGGESHLDVYERMKGFWTDLLEKKPGQCVLLVSHGGVIRHLLALAAGDSVEAIEEHAIVVNASISEFELCDDGKVKTLKVGCSEHLKQVGLDGIKMEPV